MSSKSVVAKKILGVVGRDKVNRGSISMAFQYLKLRFNALSSSELAEVFKHILRHHKKLYKKVPVKVEEPVTEEQEEVKQEEEATEEVVTEESKPEQKLGFLDDIK